MKWIAVPARNPAVFLVLLVILTRIPFVFNSLGTDLDAWYEVFSGKMLAENGVYTTSRLPGYPFSEFLFAALSQLPYWVLNLISVLFTAGACLLLYRIALHFQLQDAWLMGFTLAFIPVLYINSTVAMHYNWSLFFLLAATLSILKDNKWLAAVLIGLMVCTRFPNILYFPLFICLVYFMKGKKLRETLLFGVVALFFGVLFFLPVIIRYQGDFLHHSASEEAIPLKNVLSLLSLHTFGLLGMIGLLLCTGMYVLKKSLRTDLSVVFSEENRHLFVFSLGVIGLTLSFFVKFPFEAGYLIPMLPFVLLLAGFLCRPPLFRILSVLLLISPFVFSFNATSFSLKGVLWVNESLENQLEEYCAGIVRKTEQLPDNALVCLADYYEAIRIVRNPVPVHPERLVRFISQAELLQLQQDGQLLYYTPASNAVNMLKGGADLSLSGRLLAEDLVFEK